MGVKAMTTSGPRAANEELAPALQGLLRKLVARACPVGRTPAATHDNKCHAEEVILEADVDGVHCLLTRRQDLAAPAVSLSPREKEIARMVANGYPNKTIAAVLEISAWTVCTHLRRIFSKLGVS